MSDKIIDFNKLKNKAKEKDIDKFEDYIYSMYYMLADGKMNMSEFSVKIMAYMEENNISQDKLLDIQKKMLERYGVDPSTIEDKLNIPSFDMNPSGSNYGNLKKSMGFQEKYKNRIVNRTISEYFIDNEKNNLKLYLEKEQVVLVSEKHIDLNDNELNEFLCSYKKVIQDKPIQITICENTKNYEY